MFHDYLSNPKRLFALAVFIVLNAFIVGSLLFRMQHDAESGTFKPEYLQVIEGVINEGTRNYIDR